MESRRDQLQVLEHFNKALRADKARPQIAQLTELGLVELTRKRQGQNIYELFGNTCPTCGGLGHTVHLPGENESRLPTPPVPVEVPERFVSLPTREPRLPTARIPEPRESYDSFGDGFENDSDLGSLNLINHPSYQELNDQNKRRARTRRSRIGINGTNGKDEPRINGNPIGFIGEPDLDLDTDGELGQTPELPSPNLGKSSWTDRAERTKVIKTEPVKPVVEPPEIKTVEMTVEEQDIFALMGVSPLIKLEQEVKNPKAVIINIVQPGQTPTASPEVAPEPVTTVTPSVEVSTPKVKSEPKSVSATVTEPIKVVTTSEDSETTSTTTASRRRRRRSSAADSDTGDES